MSERVGLTTLVERACFRWIDPTPEGPKDRIHLEEYGDLTIRGELLRMSRADLTASAWWKCSDAIADQGSEYALPRLFFPHYEEDENTSQFWQAIEQVSRLDDLFFTLESDPRCRPLARDCRDDLALLNVLADWCEDHDRPITATEARHLWSLVDSILRE